MGGIPRRGKKKKKKKKKNGKKDGREKRFLPWGRSW